MVPEKEVVLLASRDPHQAEIRQRLLENAGFEVRSALDSKSVHEACAEGKVAGVVIGWSVPADEKRRVWQTVRNSCGPHVPVVELLRGNKAELLPDRALFTQEWDDRHFADTVKKILNPN